MKIPISAIVLSLLAVATVPISAATQPVQNDGDVASAVQAPRGWIAKGADNICGLKDAKQLSNPASLDFNAVLHATTEYKEIQRKGLKKGDAEYQLLHNQALTRVTNAAQKSRRANGHCSVWKKISHSDGRSIPDLTASVLANL
jgi:hypothetical protein